MYDHSPPHCFPMRRMLGFTLIEVLIVVTVLLILGGLLMSAISQVRNAVFKSNTLSLIQSLQAACEVYAREDRQRLPPPMESDLSIRQANTGGAKRTLDLLVSLGAVFHANQLGPADPVLGRPLLDGWQRQVLYKPDITMDGVMDKPAPSPQSDDWNAQSREPFAYIWSLGKPSGHGDAVDAAAANAAAWIYTRSTR